MVTEFYGSLLEPPTVSTQKGGIDVLPNGIKVFTPIPPGSTYYDLRRGVIMIWFDGDWIPAY